MIRHSQISSHELFIQIKHGDITIGGNARLKIFGKLDCASGKRMKKENRIFFNSPREAIDMGFRPCGNCMSHDYKKWSNDIIQ